MCWNEIKISIYGNIVSWGFIAWCLKDFYQMKWNCGINDVIVKLWKFGRNQYWFEFSLQLDGTLATSDCRRFGFDTCIHGSLFLTSCLWKYIRNGIFCARKLNHFQLLAQAMNRQLIHFSYLIRPKLFHIYNRFVNISSAWWIKVIHFAVKISVNETRRKINWLIF